MLICSVEGCGRKHESRGFCAAHAVRARRNGVPGPAAIETKHHNCDKSVRDEYGRKLCIRCQEWKPEAEFYRNRRCSDGLLPYCATCCRDRVNKQKTGLSRAEVDAIVTVQGGCAVCGSTEHRGRNWVVDHDHRCCPGSYHCGQCFRGVLCSHCNAALGFAKDSPDVLRALADYLDRTALVP